MPLYPYLLRISAQINETHAAVRYAVSCALGAFSLQRPFTAKRRVTVRANHLTGESRIAVCLPMTMLLTILMYCAAFPNKNAQEALEQQVTS